MPVEAGETEVVAPAAQVVDATALANSIVQGVFARLDTQPAAAPATRQERVSAFQSKAAELLKDGKIDQEVMPVMLSLIEAMGSDLTAKQQEEYQKAASAASTQAIHGELGRMVERYGATCANPELIREMSSVIVQKAIAEYNSNATLVRAYQQTGAVDYGVMDKFIVAHISKWGGTKEAGGEPAKKAGGPAMKNSAPSGAADVSMDLSKDSLDERQKEIFNSQVNFAIKERRLSREDAEKHALGLINKAESKRKSAKR